MAIASIDEKKTNRAVAPSFIDGVAKNIIIKALGKIQRGRLVLDDHGQIFYFGEAAADAEIIAHVFIHHSSSYKDILLGGSIGAGEAYMLGSWSSSSLLDVIRLMVINLEAFNKMDNARPLFNRLSTKLLHMMNANTQTGSRKNISAHYDLGNDFFSLFLDPTMMYSSGIFPSAQATMEEASLNKLNIICEKLQLCADDHVVEIGTGWGGFAIYAAKNYGCKVTTTTISQEQFNLAKQRIEQEGLQDKITLLLEDYRDLRKYYEGQFDKLVSIEMIEAVGWKFYNTFFEHCGSLLKPEGIALIQAITITDQRYDQARKDVDFIQRYIFPGSCIPSVTALVTASTKASDMNLVQAQDFGLHYARTLKAWQDTFNEKTKQVSEFGYSDDFKRMWQFYLSYCEGGFEERSIGVNHLVFAKPQAKMTYPD